MKLPPEIKAAARDWWIVLDGGGAGAGDRAAFRRWLVADPRHRQAFDKICALWGELDGAAARIAMPAVCHSKKSAKAWRWLVPVAAAACMGLWLSKPLWTLLRADFHTGFGEARDVHLSDGSTVHLNSNSALMARLDGNRRELTLLQGEAWFEVYPDKSRPFQVQAEDGRITALGTAFNVRLIERRTEVSVTEHSVSIELSQAGDAASRAVVGEGQQLAYGAETGLGVLQAVDSQAVTAWRRGKLVFENRPLGEVVAELNRYHRGLLLINDAELAQRRVNGVFRTDQPLAVITALETSLKLHSTRIGDYLIVLHR